MTEAKTVEVTQAVRERAASAVIAADGESLHIRLGDRDDLEVVQAFAIAQGRLASQSLSSPTEVGHRFGSPPEPVANPNEEWCDAYADWYYQERG